MPWSWTFLLLFIECRLLSTVLHSILFFYWFCCEIKVWPWKLMTYSPTKNQTHYSWSPMHQPYASTGTRFNRLMYFRMLYSLLSAPTFCTSYSARLGFVQIVVPSWIQTMAPLLSTIHDLKMEEPLFESLCSIQLNPHPRSPFWSLTSRGLLAFFGSWIVWV